MFLLRVAGQGVVWLIFSYVFFRSKSQEIRQGSLLMIETSFNQYSSLGVQHSKLVYRIKRQELKSKKCILFLGSCLLSLILIPNQIQHPSSQLSGFDHLDHPEVTSHWHCLPFEGSVPTNIRVLGIEYTFPTSIKNLNPYPLEDP